MTFEGQDKPGKQTKQRQKNKTGLDRAKEGGAKFGPRCVDGGEVHPTLKGGTLPRALDRGGRDGPQDLISIFWPILLVFLFASFFDAFLYRFLIDFDPQLGTKNRPKSLTNRCQDAFHLGLHFLIDVWWIFAPNFDPRNIKNR